ncbi:acriflavin resistance protein [Rugosibacter aromaticivorans]|uniref:Acriflavin resistance protein n=1 Tax=Rugosibacter aromaticivorans TaxID=1565605 RepID=A0A0C5JK71_9PROT|nr:CusA/CzcA family heavy metal efflux RND transporter [Rugosibacter aromaticivorans]AJP47776.1 acriflavin resistance protein [Rugosibacter aromaticivorans]TBR12735.1 MAG: efflux RND transporter permease subunit [Rugosibacter sp.]
MLPPLITFVLQQRIFVLLATAVIVIAGGYAISELPIEAFPDVQDVQVQIVTLMPGQAPEEIERAVTLPIEREMSGTPQLTQLRSVSMNGLSVITLTFADNTDDYFARQQVLEKLGNVTLPPGVQPGLAPLSTAVGEIYRYVIDVPAAMPDTEIRALQDWVVRPNLRMVPGVADVVSFGGAIKEYQVRVDPERLRRYAVTIDQVTQALSNASANTGAGIVRRGDEGLVVRSLGLFQNIEDIGDVAIASRNGRTVLVRDIANVVTGERPRSGIVTYNEHDSVIEGIVQMTKGENATKVVNQVRKTIDEINAKLPKGVKLKPIYERSHLIQRTVSTVVENLLVGALLVSVILVVFLRNWRSALIVASIIPLSLLFAFICMHALGVSANLMSLGAVDFGIIIDSAVVLTEALMVRLALEHSENNPQHAGLPWRMHTLQQTVMELGHPILFSKSIIILAFLPIFTFQRVEGKIFTPVALTLSFALLGGLILTLSLVPALLSFAMKREDMGEKHSPWMHRLQEKYRRILALSQKRSREVIAGSAALLILTLLLSPLLGTEFLPKLDEGNIWLTLTLPPSTALETTHNVERRVRDILRSYPEVQTVISQIGRPDDGTDPKGTNSVEILADLKPRMGWRFGDKEELISDMEKRIHTIPGVPTNFSQVIQDNVEESLSGAKGEIAVKVFGPDLTVLEDKGEQIAELLSSIHGATDVEALKVGGQSEIDIHLNRTTLSRLGVNVSDANMAVQTALGGVTVGGFYEGDRRFDITVRLAEQFRDAVDDVGGLAVALPGGGTIPLAEIARIDVRQGAARISREAGRRNVIVKLNLMGRDQGSFVTEAQAKVAAKIVLPPGYSITWGGQFENQQRAMKRLKIIVPISLGLIFLLLFWTFRSMRPAALVLAMVPFTLIGGFCGLALSGLHLSVSAAVGFIAVAGISVQNGVIMVEQVLDLLRRGASLNDAISDGAVSRLRPIIMTALMAGIGLMPAALSHGIGSETQRPFAVVIVGGIVSATLFTLLLLPVLFGRFGKERNTLDY